MRIFRLLKLNGCLKKVTRMNRALETSIFYVSSRKLIKTLQIIQYIRDNQDLSNSKIDLHDIDRLESSINSNNEHIDALVILVKDFISQYNNGYFKLNTRDFDHQIEDYKSTMSGLSGKTTAIKTILKGNRIYGDLIKQHTNFIEDEYLHEQLKEAVKYHHDLPVFIDFDSKSKLVAFSSVIKRILDKKPKCSFSTLEYQDTFNFFIQLSDSINAHNARFLYEHVFMYYQTHKKDKHFDLISYLNQLLLDHHITWPMLDNYLDAYQTKSTNTFEMWLEQRLRNKYPEAKIIRSLYLSTGSANIPSTEIDLLMFYKGYAFVIECKDYRGTIFGSYSKPVWTQVIKTTYQYKPGGKYYTKNSTFELKNPIKQNEMHISVLNKYIPFDYKNIVVFGGNAELKVAANYVYTPLEYFNIIDKIVETNIDTNGIYYKLLLENIGSNPSVKSRHIEAIQSKYGK